MTLVNKVKEKPIVQLDPEQWLPNKNELLAIDLKDFLFKELLLKEKEFRAQLKALDWSDYNSKYVAIHCSSHAIIPLWAYMLVQSYLSEQGAQSFVCAPEDLDAKLMEEILEHHDWENYRDQRVVVKGCGSRQLQPKNYATLTHQLIVAGAKAVMFGEPCSMVPVYRKK